MLVPGRPERVDLYSMRRWRPPAERRKYSAIWPCVGPEIRSRSVTCAGARPVRKYPPICAAVPLPYRPAAPAPEQVIMFLTKRAGSSRVQVVSSPSDHSPSSGLKSRPHQSALARSVRAKAPRRRGFAVTVVMRTQLPPPGRRRGPGGPPRYGWMSEAECVRSRQHELACS